MIIMKTYFWAHTYIRIISMRCVKKNLYKQGILKTQNKKNYTKKAAVNKCVLSLLLNWATVQCGYVWEQHPTALGQRQQRPAYRSWYGSWQWPGCPQDARYLLSGHGEEHAGWWDLSDRIREHRGKPCMWGGEFWIYYFEFKYEYVSLLTIIHWLSVFLLIWQILLMTDTHMLAGASLAWLDTVTPRSGRLSHVSSVVLFTLHEGTGLSLRRVIHITFHLDGLNWRELLFDHQFSESKSDCKTEISWSVSISLKMNVSSAYAQIVDLRWRWRSFAYMWPSTTKEHWSRLAHVSGLQFTINQSTFKGKVNLYCCGLCSFVLYP